MQFLNKLERPISIAGLGEAMVEFAPVSAETFRRGFAGDTLNTLWYMRKVLPEVFRVSFITRVGTDALSNEFIAFLSDAGIDSEKTSRDPERTLGLYTITLEGSERRFSYWRENSAARRLADELVSLEKCFSDVALIYLSGISLAIIGESGRRNLFGALKKARSCGVRVAFDSNIRMRLWPDEKTARKSIEAMLPLADIALPSFDDEAGLWNDPSPEGTIRRLVDSGVNEIVVKNGAGAALVRAGDAVQTIGTEGVQDAVDTTAAGDSFNAGYLAARCVGASPALACRIGHSLAGEVVRHPGALAPFGAFEPTRKAIEKIVQG